MPIHEQPGLARFTLGLIDQAGIREATADISSHPHQAAQELAWLRIKVKELAEELKTFNDRGVVQPGNIAGPGKKTLDNANGSGIMGS